MAKNDGGTAFPMQDGTAIHAYALAASHRIKDHEERETAYISARAEAVAGMSLRDYFAAKFAAAQATSTSADRDFLNPDYRYPENQMTVAEKIARVSYDLADAMLDARKQPKDPSP